MKNIIFLFIVVPCLLIAQNNNENKVSNKTEIIETCTGNIKKDKKEVTCSGLNALEKTNTIFLEEGDYKGLWNSKATKGAVFKDLKVTARITKVSDTEYTGALYISDKFKSCCKTPGINGDGIITLKIIERKITFKWMDELVKCPGEFNGTGTYSESNRIILNLTGNDCDGDHVGSIEFFK